MILLLLARSSNVQENVLKNNSNDIFCRYHVVNLFFTDQDMSNSKRKHPILPNCIAISEKAEKLQANRKLRRLVKEKLSDSNYELPASKEVASNWNWRKDGKSYRSDLTNKQLTK